MPANTTWEDDPFADQDFFASRQDPFATQDPFAAPQDGWMLDSVKGVGRGLAGAVESIAELPAILPGIDYDIPDNFGLGHSTTTVGSFVEGTTQFLSGFIPIAGVAGRIGAAGKAARIASKLERAGKAVKAEEILRRAGQITGQASKLKASIYAKNFATGALADFVVFAEDEARLSNMLREIPGLEENTVLNFLAQDDEDGALESRLKNVLEGGIAGVAVDGVMQVLKGFKNRVKILAENTTTARKQELLEANEAYIEEGAEKGLADPNGPEFEVDRQAERDLMLEDEVVVEAEPKTLAEEFPDLAAAEYRDLQAEAKRRGVKATQSAAALREQLAEARRAEPEGAPPKTKADELDLDWQNYQAKLIDEYESVDKAPKGKQNALKGKRNKAARMRSAERIIGVSEETFGQLSPLQVRVREFAQEALDHGAVDRDQALEAVSRIEEALANGEDVLEKLAGVVNTATLSPGANRKLAILYAVQDAADNAVDHLGNPLPKEQVGKGATVDRPRGRGAKEGFVAASEREAGERAWAHLWGQKPEEVAAWSKRLAASIGEDSLNATALLGYIDRHLNDMELLHRAAKGDQAALKKVELTQDQALIAVGHAERDTAELFKGWNAIRREHGRALHRHQARAARMMTPEMMEISIREMGGRDAVLSRGDKLFEARNLGGKNNMAAVRMIEKFDRKAQFSFMLNEYFVNFVLSSVRTFSTNTLGNLATTVYGPMEALLGARVGQGVAHLKGKPTEAYAAEAARALDEFSALYTQFSEALRWGRRAWKKGDYILDDTAAALDLPQHMKEAWNAKNAGSVLGRELDPEKGLGHAIEWFGSFLRLPSRALMATDEFYKQWNYRSSVTADLLFEGRKKLAAGEIDNLDEFVRVELDALTRRGQALTERNLQIAARKKFRPNHPKYQHALGIEEMEADQRAWMQQQMGNPEVLDRGLLAERALEKARYRTFTKELDSEAGALSSLGVSMTEFGNKHPLFRLFVPFIRTPLNILMYAGERTALPGLNKDITGAAEYLYKVKFKDQGLDTLRNRFAREITSDDATVRSAALGRASAAMGFASVFSVAALAGTITGAGPRDRNQRNLMTQAGWQPYSFKFGDTYVSYQKMDPFATILGIYADMADAGKYSDSAQMSEQEGVVVAALISVLHNIESKSYLQGLVQVSSLIDEPERAVAKTGGRLMAALTTPSLVASMRDVVDPNMVAVRSMVDQMLSRVPLLGAAMLDPQRTVLGEPVDKKTFDGAARFAADTTNVLLPLLINQTSDDLVTNELAALAFPLTLPQPKKYGTDLTDYQNSSGQSAYDRWLELSGTVRLGEGSGRTLRQQLRRLIQSRRYQELPTDGVSELDADSPRVSEVQRIITRYRAAALRQMLTEFPEVRAQARNQTIANEALRRGVSVDVVRDVLFPMQ